ncbi:MAG: shikimate kinase [Phycisphaerales bacterium]|nr:shikimate kinase [Phycisphaerales bacterium]
MDHTWLASKKINLKSNEAFTLKRNIPMTHPKPNLILIGLRASGKSTLGSMLAQSLHLPLVDLDDVSANLLGCDGAGAAIEKHGIDSFRDAETKALRSTLDSDGQVISLGGGTPTAPGCAQILEQSSGRVIYLRALPETLRQRLSVEDNTDRPPLVGDNTIDEVQTLFDARDELYQRIAESVIHIDGVSQESVFAALIAICNAGA